MIIENKIVRLIFSAVLCACFLQAAAKPGDNDDTKLTKTIERDFSMSENGYLELINKYGQVVINTWSKDSVNVKVKITAYGKDYDDAEKMLERVDIDFRSTSPYLTIETILDRKSGFFKELWNNISDYSKTLLSKNKIEIDYEINMPETMVLDIENKFGDIYMHEVSGKCRINLMHGNLRANKFNAASNIEVGYGDVRIKQLNEGVLVLKGVEADIIKLGNVNIKSSSSEVTIKEANKISLDSRGDQRFNIDKVSILEGKATFSKIELQEMEKTLKLDMNYGELRVKSIPFSFNKIDLSGKYTDITLGFMPNSYLLVDISAKDESLFLPHENVKLDKVYTDDKQRYVRVKGRIGAKSNYPGNVYINTSGGDVTINVPGLQHSVNK
ncbi:DUF4097 family beta strand repeat protein [Fulvivirga sp. 29W222]|uniref:DUF4097 family beta strand repeat protein n=1 Tax=Fulvivirga marina TaxID=2494733 RepID=A0A937KDJ3_9BACT|nr:DUF4097 family beta strand repeat-containing protein [Fulvivirga marina]MBL6446120.1 DUF4097 family beta strand repeat protein [Fulvivirga marina]